MAATIREQQQSSSNPPGNSFDPEAFYNSWRFSQAVLVGDTLLLTGPLANKQEGQRGPAVTGTVDEQARLALQNLALALEAAQRSVAAIIEFTSDHVGIEDLPRGAALTRDLIPEGLQTWSAIGITESPVQGMVLAIKTTDHRNETSKSKGEN